MNIRMAQPWRHPKTNTWYYRAKIPLDLLPAIAGQKLSVEVSGKPTTVRLVETVKISLRTKDQSIARIRHAAVSTQIEKRWALERQTAPSVLTQRDVNGLAGLWYREMVADHEEDPGDFESWDVYREPIIEALDMMEQQVEGIPPRADYDPAKGLRHLEKLFDVDDFLMRQQLRVDQRSRQELLKEIALAVVQAAETLQRRSLGDYRPDNHVSRFPELNPSSSPAPGSSVSLTELFEGWLQERDPRISTNDQWRKYIVAFASFVGHQDASRVVKADVVKWKEHLLQLGNKPKTINGSKLAALGAVFGWAVQNDRLPFNPTSGVTVRRSKKAGEAMQGFTYEEASTILAAASKSLDPVCRWIPLLCAQSGARISEVCQLRAEDIGRDNGICYMHIRAEAGSLKNASSERRIPVHPHVTSSGFLDFVNAKGSGPLFFDPEKRRPGAKKPQAKIVGKRVARWVHSLGLDVGKEHRKAPNHAWRHTFRTLAREHEIIDTVLDAIEGHGQQNEGRRYGTISLKAMFAAIEKIGLPGITSDDRSKLDTA